ncbi:MAG: AAA family ATPase [Myxococcota bacterium]
MASLKIERLHLRELRAIRRLDLPEDGLGWGGVFPDTVVVGGGNGSGKTTLLNWIVTAVGALAGRASSDRPLEGRLELAVGPRTFTCVGGTGEYVAEAVRTGSGDSMVIDREGLSPLDVEFPPASGKGPRVLFVPSPRSLDFPNSQLKTAGLLNHPADFIHRWRVPKSWSASAEAQLYEARWLDLNAKEEGRPADAVHFARYADAFRSLIPGRTLTWRNGALVVHVEGTDVHHGLDALSSGEKQVLLLLADLLLHWAPGSLVLIDEPELHLHPSLQIRFFEALQRWRAERGGQLWLATQSTELFGHAPVGTQLLLGAGSL